MRVGLPRHLSDVLRVLAHLIEDDHSVVERICQDGQEADQRCRRHLESDQGIDTDRDEDIMEEGDEGSECHLRFEGHREVDHHDDEEGHQTGDAFTRDLLPP